MFELIRAHQLNIMLGLSSICVVVGFFALITKTLPIKRKLAIAYLEFVSSVLLYSDRLAYIYHGDPSFTGYWMVRITNFLVFFMTISVVHALNAYLTDLSRNELALAKIPFRLRMVELIVVTGWILVIISQFTGWYYTFDASNSYQRGPLFLLSYLVPFVALFIQLSVIVQNIKRMSAYISVPMILLTVAPMLASVLQAKFYGVSLTNMAIVGMAIVVYVFAIIEMNDFLEKAQNRQLDEANQKSLSLRKSFEQTVAAVANAVDARDRYTKGHSLRVAGYARQIAKALGLDERECFGVYQAAALHDIGKVEIPDVIRTKTEHLTEEEKETMREHAAIGGKILSAVDELPYLQNAVKYHHERYDGNGYPEGLKGDKIPLYARIIAVADAYDEMTSFKADREPLAQGKVREVLLESSGSRFDPAIVEIMVAMIDKDTDYMMREAEEENVEEADKNDLTVVNKMHFENYKEQVSDGLRISKEYLKISFETRPDEGADAKASIPAIILFDSFDRCVHRNERSIKNLRYFEFGEIWMDGHTVSTAARDIKAEVTAKKASEELAADAWIRYEIEAVCIKDHVRIKIINPLKSCDVTVALPDATRYVFLGLTGEHCSIRNIAVKEVSLFGGADPIERIAPQVNYFTRKDGDIPNLEVDEYRETATEGMPVEDGMRLFFHAQALPMASAIYHCGYLVLYSSDDGVVRGKNYAEYACIRLDGDDCTEDGKAQNELIVEKEEDFEGWDAFKELTRRGMDYEVRFSRKKNRITFETENAGISLKCRSTIANSSDPVFVALTGNLCTLTDIRVR